MINAEDRLISFTRENLPPPDSEIQAYLDGLKARADKRMAARPLPKTSIHNGQIVIQSTRGKLVPIRTVRVQTILTK